MSGLVTVLEGEASSAVSASTTDTASTPGRSSRLVVQYNVCWGVHKAVLRTGAGLDPDPRGSIDLDPDCISGSRKEKMTYNF